MTLTIEGRRSQLRTGRRNSFVFPKVHGIFKVSLPPRHPPIVAVEGFSNSGRIRNCAPQLPAAAQAVAHDLHSGQGRLFVPSQSRLKTPHLHVDAAEAKGHSALGLPPADAFKPADRLSPDSPLTAATDDGAGPAVSGSSHQYIFHARRLWRGTDISRSGI